MGYGSYSHEAHEALLRDRSSRPEQQVFTQTECHALMSPKGVRVRESRDSPDHPSSLGVVFALDVTGSMGAIPKLLAREELPTFMKVLEACKVPDPQLLFMAIGDAHSDRAALQVGQFESTAELMDRWLTWTFLEGGGGPWGQESYELGMYFLAQHTEMDCFVKRKKRGYVFITGDEKPYPVLSKHTVDGIIGDRLDDDLLVEEIVALLQESFVPFFLIPDQRRRAGCEKEWRDLLGDHVICMNDPRDVCWVAASAVLIGEGLVRGERSLVSVLEAAGAPPERLKSAVRALAPLLADEPGEAPGLLDRLIGAVRGE
ncbi:VWA domain-containing protein [Myxococcota bacterium]|nr:VWA domain-containing protein [Myxococcota bacterium]